VIYRQMAMQERAMQIISVGNNVKNWYYRHSSKAKIYQIIALNDDEKWQLTIPHEALPLGWAINPTCPNNDIVWCAFHVVIK